MAISEFIVANRGIIPNEPLADDLSPDILSYLLYRLDNDPGLLDQCLVEYNATNTTQNGDFGSFNYASNYHPNAKFVLLKDLTVDASVVLQYGNHAIPSTIGTVNLRHHMPDVVITDQGLDMCNWSRALPVIEGHICRPVQYAEKVFALDGVRWLLAGRPSTPKISVLDFSDIGDIVTVPLANCTFSATDPRVVTAPTSIDMTGKTVMAVVQGRLILPYDCKVAGQSVFLNISHVNTGYYQVEDKVALGELDPHNSVYYPTLDDYQYLTSPDYVRDSFLVLVDTPTIHATHTPEQLRIGRNRFIFKMPNIGILMNPTTGLLCHTLVERVTEQQLVLCKSGKRYYPNHSDDGLTTAVHPGPTDAEGHRIDSDRMPHSLLTVYAIKE
jgi:hypothetical protein